MLQGTGTELDPYLITNLVELRTEVNDNTKFYKVVNDLDVVNTEYEELWGTFYARFKQLDFDNKKLSNLRINDGVFHFEKITDDAFTAKIKNFKFENITMLDTSLFITNQDNVNASFSNTPFFLENGRIKAINTINTGKILIKENANWPSAYVIKNVEIDIKSNVSFEMLARAYQSTWQNVLINLNVVGSINRVLDSYPSIYSPASAIDNVMITGKFGLVSQHLIVNYGSGGRLLTNVWVLAEITGQGTSSTQFAGITSAQNKCFYITEKITGFGGFQSVTNVLQVTDEQARSYEYLSSQGFLVVESEGWQLE